MQVTQDTVVSLQYELLGSDGELIEKTEAPIEYLHGGYDGIFAAVEQALDGKAIGESCDVYLEPVDAFGEYDASLVQIEPRAKFPGGDRRRHAFPG
jgi:FKBP-type peptidyl-prolyl cis-trans isomerase SlyD